MDEAQCPYCASDGNCEHLLLAVDETFRDAFGGALFEQFADRWRSIVFDNDQDFDALDAFSALLETVGQLADGSVSYEIAEVPGQSSSCQAFYCRDTDQIESAVLKFEGAS